MQKEITNFTKRIFLFLCFCALWGASKAQIQIGAGIDGQFANEAVGARLGFSSAGTRVAVGANNYTNTMAAQGRARVFEDVNGVWTQIGSNIEGQAMLEESGAEIALSGDGTTLAVYSPNEGNFFIKIYKDISGVWTQQGTAIYSRVSSLVLSEDGSVIGIGNELGAGSCAVYQWNGTAWTQLGTTILGSGNERMGFSADMSADGLTVLLGGTEGKGSAKVYEFILGAWVQKGTTLVGDANNQDFGRSVSLSSDGTTLAVGARENAGPLGNVSKLGQVKIYKWQNGAWTQLGASIYGELAVDYFGQSVALSADGTVLAASAYFGDNPTTGVQDVGYTKRFRWVGSYWMLENTIYGQASADDTGWTTAISADGNRIAIGAPRNAAVASGSGRVRVFGFCSPPPPAYNLTGGGYSCNGTGVVVGLADSDVGVEYQLMRGVPNVSNPVNVGSPVAGTGNAISFGAQTTSGTFIVKANNLTASCSGFMSGSVAATIENANVMPTIAIVSNDIDNTIWATESVTFTATATNGGFFPVYQWKKNGTNVGTGSLTYTDANLANNDIITCELTSSNSCATTPNVTSNSLTMTVNQSPAGAALHFDGSNDYVKLPAGLGAALSSANNTAITLEYWFKGTSVQSAIRLQEVNDPGNFIVAGWGGKHIISTDGGINGINVGSNVTDGNWHHVAMTWQRNTINGFRSYLDGVLVEQRNAADVNLPLVENGLAIGARYDFWYTEEHTNGTIDEVRMWNRALTQCEIQNNMSCELASGQTGLVAYYKFNQGLIFLNNSSVTSLTDASGNGFNATLTNFALTGTTSNWISGGAVTTGVSCTTPVVAVSIVSNDADNVIMTGTKVIFTATPTNGGTSPVYQWRKNGNNVGTNSAVYADSTLANNDMISCKITSSNVCISPDSAVSNSLTMAVFCLASVSPTFTGLNTDYCKTAGLITLAASPSGGVFTINGTIANSFDTDVFPLGAHTISYTYIDGIGCMGTVTQAVNMLATPVAPTLTSTQSSYCVGAVASLSGSTALEYAWFRNGTFVKYSNTGDNYTFATLTGTNQYSLAVIYTPGGCLSAQSSTVSVTGIAPAAVITPSIAPPYCVGAAPTLNANTGTNYTYSWIGTSSTAATTTTSTFVPTKSGNHRVIVTDADGCSKSSAWTGIVLNALPNANAGTDKNLCVNSGTTLGTTSALGYSYSWSPSTNLSSTSIYNPTVTPTAVGSITYTLTTTRNGCSKTDQVLVAASANPATPTLSSTTSPVCQGASITLIPFGYTGATNWYKNGVLTTSAATAAQITLTAASASQDSYTIRARNGSCLSAPSTAVSTWIKPAPTPTISSTPAATNFLVTICNPGQTTGTANLQVAIPSGAPTVASYNWQQVVSGMATNVNPAAITSTYTASVASVPSSQNNKLFRTEVTYSNACVKSTTTMKVQLLPSTCTGRTGQDLTESIFTAYPNPTENMLTVSIQNSRATEGELMLYNTLGQVVTSRTISLSNGSIEENLDLSGLASGIYTLSFQTKEGNKVQKIVKE